MAVSRRPLAAFGVAIVLAVGSLATWIAIPAAWLWVGSRVGGGSNFASYLVALFACPISMIAFAGLLSRLDDLHSRLAWGVEEHQPVRPGWLRSLSAEGHVLRRGGLLDAFMLVSALASTTAFLFWFFFMDHAPLSAQVL
jgi:hypothetical protein